MNKVSFQILAFDGGGIRGAFGVGVIAQLERELGRPIENYFDLVAGTSTGAITGAAIARGKSGQELLEFYARYGRQIFTPREPHAPEGWLRWFYPVAKRLLHHRTGQNFDDFLRARYCPHALQEALQQNFGERVLGDMTAARLIVPTVNLTLGKSRLFRTPHLPELQDDAQVRMVDVLLAATAAPTYFPHKVMPDGHAYCDGGLWAVNPCVLAVAEAMKIKQLCKREACDPDYDTSDIRVLSIGTGSVNYSLSPPGSDAGILYWARHMADVMTNLQVEGTQYPMRFLLGNRYHCINFELPDESWSLDNTEHMDELVRIGRRAAERDFGDIAATYFERAKPPYVPYKV